MAKKQINKLLTGLAGEYMVAGIMNMKGWVASLTLKNYPGIDIFGQNPNNSQNISVQVKTSRENSFNIGLKHNERSEIYNRVKGPYVFVHISSNEDVSYYILSRDEFINLVNTTDDLYFRARKHPIKDTYPIAVSLKDLLPYEDKWDSLWK